MEGTQSVPCSERLLFRRPGPADARSARTLRQDPRAMRYLGGPTDARTADERFARNVRHWDTYGFGSCVLLDRATGDFVGLAGLQMFEGEPDLGYVLDPAWWGRGLGSELAAACLRHGFEDRHMRLIRAHTQVANRASQQVLTKVGMRYLGERVLWDQRQRRYAITADEWEWYNVYGADRL